MIQIPDDPIIRMMERTGYPSERYQDEPRCPVCGELCETLYKDRYGDIVGCDECITTLNAWEENDE